MVLNDLQNSSNDVELTFPTFVAWKWFDSGVSLTMSFQVSFCVKTFSTIETNFRTFLCVSHHVSWKYFLLCELKTLHNIPREPLSWRRVYNFFPWRWRMASEFFSLEKGLPFFFPWECLSDLIFFWRGAVQFFFHSQIQVSVQNSGPMVLHIAYR